MPPARIQLSDDDVAAPDLLDRLRSALATWSDSLHDPATGGFRQDEAIGPNVLASSDMVWIGHAVGARELGGPDPGGLARFLASAQDPASGAIHHDPGPGGQGHGDGHAFWQVSRALRLLGAPPPTWPRALAPIAEPEGLDAWFGTRRWEAGGDGHHHDVLGLVPLIARRRNPALVETLLLNIDRQRDPASGTWPRGAAKPDVSRTFAYTALHLAVDELPAGSERIVDAMLDLQRPNGLWDLERPHFHTMDAAYLLVRLPRRLGGHRASDARDALDRLERATREALHAGRDAYAANPHAVLALVHTLGLLQEAFPERLPSEPHYRFDWDVLDQYAAADGQDAASAARGGIPR